MLVEILLALTYRFLTISLGVAIILAGSFMHVRMRDESKPEADVNLGDYQVRIRNFTPGMLVVILGIVVIVVGLWKGVSVERPGGGSPGGGFRFEATVEDAADEVEEAADEAGDAVEEAADEADDATEDAAEGDEEAAEDGGG